VCFMGDDGNQNWHMKDADSVAQSVEKLYPNLLVKRIMWDAYTRVSSSTGNSYPDVTRLIKQQMQQGALLFNYSGHGRADAMSHEYVLSLADFQTATSMRLPLWVTASCDIMPFDGQEDNIGEAAFFNKKGGAIAFYGTTRTVYQSYNRLMNLAFTRHVLSRDDSGRPMPIGEAVRRTKNELLTTHQDDTPNKLQYTLLGDPALRLAVPTHGIQVDSVNSTLLDNGTMLTLKAGTKATVTGRVLGADGMTASAFNGILTAVLRDIREQITCRLNDTSKDGAEEPFVYYDRPNVVYSGSDSVRNGRFSLTFAVPKDIQYSDLDVQLNLYAVNTDKTIEANGICNQLAMNGTAEHGQGTAGPNIYCYLNSTAFTNGGSVNTTPYFVAEVNDEDGINVSSSGIGHDLQLIIDGDMSKT
ncbi:MAG: type IX secretion system sortase PorU, partial [Prevotella sp.]|nr:type IX secretion system sortase PorU [Prevotella sp.]